MTDIDSTVSTLSTPLPPGHAEWLAKRERTRKLRAELKAARDAGKRVRHQRRLEQIRRRDQMTESTTGNAWVWVHSHNGHNHCLGEIGYIDQVGGIAKPVREGSRSCRECGKAIEKAEVRLVVVE